MEADLRIIIFILWVSNYIIVGSGQLENYQLIGDSQKVSHQNEVYKDDNNNEWTTYTMGTSGTLSMRILQDGNFKFAWKLDKLGSKNKLYLNINLSPIAMSLNRPTIIMLKKMIF